MRELSSPVFRTSKTAYKISYLFIKFKTFEPKPLCLTAKLELRPPDSFPLSIMYGSH